MSATQQLLRFGVFELNLATEELRRGETPLKLSPQPLQLLALLASHAGQVLSREEIQRQLWSEESEIDFEHGVTQCIKQIRTALKDNADRPLYIETVHRRGYCFIAPVESKTVLVSAPKVVEVDSGMKAPVPSPLAGREGQRATAVALSFPAAMPDVDGRAEPGGARVIAEPRSKVQRVRSIWIGAVALVGLLGGGFYWSAHKGPAFSEKDTIVLAAFDNKTGDAVFDGTLRTGLWADLDQSPFLNILSDQRITQTMALMTQPKDARLTSQLAREVCIRTGSVATLEGTITVLGEEYVVGLKAVNCQTGDEITVEQVTAGNKEKVLPALGKAASQIRRKLGESRASIQKYDVPLESVTTPSLEALQAYSQGYRAFIVNNDVAAAIPLFQQAVDLDPNFAMAYALLGTCYGDQGETARSADNLRKAYELHERLSEREQLYITSHYAQNVTGDLEAARKDYESWTKIYPHDDTAADDLALMYERLGDYDKALAAHQKSLELNSGTGLGDTNLVNSYLLLNRLDEAKKTAQDAQVHNPNNTYIHVFLYLIAFLQQDAIAMQREAAAVRGTPDEGVMLCFQSDTAAYYGQFSKARELMRLAVDSAQGAGDKETAAGCEAEAAVREALVGNIVSAKLLAQSALRRSHGRDVEAIAGIALALAANADQAKRLGDDLAELYPSDTVVQSEYLPMIYAAAALGSGHRASDPKTAIESLSAAAPYELGQTAQTVNFTLYPVYLRGDAYLAARQGTAATAEFQKILDHPGVVQNELIGALAHLGLGRAYALAGDAVKAKDAYQNFLTIWKDADPDIPILIQAKAEYARLR